MNPIVPPPLGLGRPSRQSIQYRLVVVQNPTRARCCGFGEKDKRPINPPPILQLYIARPDGALGTVSETDNVSHLIVQCDLFSADRKQNRNVVYNPASINPAYPNSHAAVMTFQDPKPVRNFLGTLVSNAHQLNDLDERLGIFFIFSDLSVRTEGAFCLRFRFIDLSAGDPLTMSTEILHEVYSDPFQVYSAKNFPGMTGTTPLSQCFSRQGIKISVRKGPGVKRTSDDVFGGQSNDDDNNNARQQQQQHQEQEPSSQQHPHQHKSVMAIAAFVSSGIQTVSGNEGDSGGADGSSRTELKETTTQLRSREATVATASSEPVTMAPATPYTKIHISSVLASDDEDSPPWRRPRQ